MTAWKKYMSLSFRKTHVLIWYIYYDSRLSCLLLTYMLFTYFLLLHLFIACLCLEAQAGFQSPGLCELCSWSLLHAALLMASPMPVWFLFFCRWLLFVLFSGDAFGNHLLSLMFCNFNRICLGFPHSFFLALLSLFNLEAVSSTVGHVPPQGCISSSPCVLAVLPLWIPHSGGCTPSWFIHDGFFSLILSASLTFCSKLEGFLNLTFKLLCFI